MQSRLAGAKNGAPPPADPLKRSRWDYLLVIAVAATVMMWRLGLPMMDGHECFVSVTARTMADPGHWFNDTADPDSPLNTTANHWLVPVFNGESRLEKVPLAYWQLAGLLKLGLPENAFTDRLPSAIAAVLLAVMTLALGRRMFSHRAALLGVLMMTTCLSVFGWGRNARVDISLTLWMVVGMWLFYIALDRPRTRVWPMLAGFAALGVAGLAKQIVPLFLALPVVLYLSYRTSEDRAEAGEIRVGPAGWPRRELAIYLLAALAGLWIYMVIQEVILASDAQGHVKFLDWCRPLLDMLGLAQVPTDTIKGYVVLGMAALGLGGPTAWYFFRCQTHRRFLPLLPVLIVGVVLAVAASAAWWLYMRKLFPNADEMASHQTLERGLGTGGWSERSATGLTGYYFLRMFKLVVPWVVFVPGAVIIPFRKAFAGDRRGLTFLLLWVFGVIVLFSAAAGKHDQYILPAVPAMCLLMGYCAEDVFFRHRLLKEKWAGVLMLAHAVVLTLLLAGTILMVFYGDKLGAGFSAKMKGGYQTLSAAHWRPRYVHIAVLACLATGVLWAGYVLHRLGRKSLAVGSLVAAAAAVMIGFATRADLWDELLPTMRLTGKIVETIPPGKPIATWGTLDGSVIYHFGHDIPDARDYLTRLQQRKTPDAARVWGQWMRPGDTPRWLISDKPNLESGLPGGYVVDERMFKLARDKLDPVLLRPKTARAASAPTSRPAPTTPEANP